jgi:putative ABC transport system permease protein
MQDLQYAFRLLRKRPAFTIVAVLTLALGIGANTAIFSVVNALLLKPLPFPRPSELVALGSSDTREKGSTKPQSLSYPDFFDLRDQNHTLAGAAVFRTRNYALTGEDAASGVMGARVSAEFFDVLGIQPAIGHAFVRQDEGAGGGPGGLKVILSDSFWKSHFGGDVSVVGRSISLDRKQYSIIGVMPPRFQYPIQNDPIELYVTIADDASTSDGTKPPTEQRGNHSLDGIARLKAGVTVSQASTDLSAIAANLEKQYPNSNTNFGVLVKPLREELIGDVRTALYVLFGAVICVLLIANANVANLLLARATERGKEIALRAAVGASRSRIIRQLLIESLLLAIIGGLGGLLIAQWGTEALIRTVPQNIPRISTIRLDGVVLAFTLLISFATGIVFGLVPAWQASHVDLNSALKTGGRTGTGAEHKGRLRNALVMAEVALALILLVSAGLLIQSFERLGRVNSGLRTDRLLTARLSLPGQVYPKNENVIQFYDRFLERLRAIPGAESVSAIMPLPLSGNNMTTDFDIEEHSVPEGRRPTAPVRIIATDYFKTMGIPVREGRTFDETDQLNSRPVVIVNQRFASKFFPGQDVIGKRITLGFSADDTGEKTRDIMGVVGNVKHSSLKNEDSPEMYLSRTQLPLDLMSIVVRTRVSDAAQLTNAVRAELAAIDPALPLGSVRIFDDYVSQSLARPRFNALLLSIFAGTALILTAVGIYGVIAYSVSQRTNEIGIRMALGAERSNIFRLIVGQAMSVVAISVVIGLVGAFAATRLLSSLLFGIGASDPLTFGAIVLLIAAVAFIASWLPARRAASVNPIVALRAD